MPRLIAAVVRHGNYRQLPDTPSAHQPFPLDARGVQQADACAQTLRQALLQFDCELCRSVDCSRLLRAWQTAQRIVEQFTGDIPGALTVDQFDALAERGLGSAANLSVRAIEQVLSEDPRFASPPADWKSNSRYRLPLQGAESLLDAGERVAAHMEQRMRQLSDAARSDTLKVFVGHGAAFRHAAYLMRLFDYEQIARLSMYHARPVFIEYRGAGQWRHVGGDWKIRASAAQEID